jgi:uncharacterized membrane protein (DUF485 family)
MPVRQGIQKMLKKEAPMSALIASKIQTHPKYHELVKRRDSLAWTLSAIVCVIYFGFILMIAFASDFLTQPMAADSVIPIGMPIGVGVILASCLLTGIYVFRANNTFDPLIEEIIRESSK